MPYLNLITNKKITKEQEKTFIEVLGKGLETEMDKKEEFLFIKITDDCTLYRAGTTDEPCAMITIEFSGLITNEGAAKYNEVINEVVIKELNVPKNRIFVSFTECRHWGSPNGGVKTHTFLNN